MKSVKHLSLAGLLGLSLVSAALADPAEQPQGPVYKMEIDWSRANTLSDTVVQQCDDTYYGAVEIIVPGKPGDDFSVEMVTDVTHGGSSLGCKILSVKTRGGKTTYKVTANDSCGVNVYKRIAPNERRGRQMKAELEIHDAC